MSEPILNLSRYSAIVFQDSTALTTTTAPSLSTMSGSISETQLPTTIGSGTSLQLLDIGTF